MNAMKTKAVVHTLTRTPPRLSPITSKAGAPIEIVHDFVYLGAWVDSSVRDIKDQKSKGLDSGQLFTI